MQKPSEMAARAWRTPRGYVGVNIPWERTELSLREKVTLRYPAIFAYLLSSVLCNTVCIGTLRCDAIRWTILLTSDGSSCLGRRLPTPDLLVKLSFFKPSVKRRVVQSCISDDLSKLKTVEDTRWSINQSLIVTVVRKSNRYLRACVVAAPIKKNPRNLWEVLSQETIT